MKKLYYMHPMNTYGTELESRQLERISKIFKGWEIVNPNTPEHQEGCQRVKKETGNAMPYFIELASSCHGGVALPFRDGKFGSGIWAEALAIRQNHYPVWQLTFDGQFSLLNTADDDLQLNVEETRKRIRSDDGGRKEF